MVEIDATFAADSSVSAGGAVAYDAASTMAGSASASGAAGVLFSVVSAMAGSATAANDVEADYAGAATMAGAAASSMAIVLRKQIIAAMAASSTVSAMLDSDLTVSLTLLGAAGFLVDPAKVTIVNFSRGAQVPESARPATIPTIRISPPARPAASYSVGSPDRRQRRGL